MLSIFYYIYLSTFIHLLTILPLLSLSLYLSTECKTLEKPEPVKTHLRNMVIIPEMVGAQVAVYNGKVFNLVEIKADMIGYYLGEFSITYHPVRHGRPGLGGANGKFMPMGK